MASTRTKIIKVVVQTSDKALKKMSQQFDRLNRSVKKMSGSMNTVRNAFIGMFAAVGIRSIAQTMDTFQLMQDRLKIFTGSAKEAQVAFYDLAEGARFVKSSISTLGDAYNKIAVATSDLGFNSEQVLGIVLAMQQTLRLSGAAAQEAASVFLQFGQALSLGRIQGQELRAIMLGNAKYTQLLADKMDVAKGTLKKMGEEGKLTNEKILSALLGNFKALNTEAGFLNQTFEQTTIIVFDAVKIKLKELNEEFKLSVKFASVARFALENFDDILVGLGASLTAAALAFGAVNLPLTGVLVGLGAVGVAAFYVSKNIKKMKLTFYELIESFTGLGASTKQAIIDWTRFLGIFGPAAGTFGEIARVLLSTANATGLTKEEMAKLRKEVADMDKAPGDKMKDFMDRITAATKSALDALLKGRSGKGVVGAFSELNRQFAVGIKAGRDYAYGVRSIRIDELYAKFTKGKISIKEFTDAFEKINEEFKNLTRGEGAFAGIELGAKSAADAIGTLAKQISGVVNNAFNNLEDRLFDFVKKGKFEFRKFAEAILDDLTRVIIRMAIIRPLAGAATSAFAPQAPTYDLSNTTTAPRQATVAKGGLFSDGNILPFAKGGVVSSPTVFPMANGTGLMGEDGPEAVMPLARDSQGRLGVRGGGTVVNIINNSTDTETKTEESTGPNGEKQIDVFVVNKVSSAIGEGRMDKVFKQVYGLNRRGA
jgi:lambda family phage tail tape measure protein